MNIKVNMLLIGLLLVPMTVFSQEKILKWGLSAPVLTNSAAKDLALSRRINDNYMALMWGYFYYDKNTDETPNQDLFKSLCYTTELEIRRNLIRNSRVTPYVGLVAWGLYNRDEEEHIYLSYEDGDYRIKVIDNTKCAGFSLSFGAEYFITRAVSIFAHTRLLNVYEEWNTTKYDYTEGDDYTKNRHAIKTKGFERSTLYVRFYF
jgi:hypothetical protein